VLHVKPWKFKKTEVPGGSVVSLPRACEPDGSAVFETVLWQIDGGEAVEVFCAWGKTWSDAVALHELLVVLVAGREKHAVLTPPSLRCRLLGYTLDERGQEIIDRVMVALRGEAFEKLPADGRLRVWRSPEEVPEDSLEKLPDGA
jgi:hypothetical protein